MTAGGVGSGGRAARSRTSLVTRVRTAGRLDRIRWLVVYSADFANACGLVGLAEIYAGWRAGLPWPLAVTAGLMIVAVVAMSTRPTRIAVRGGRRPTALLVVAGVLTLVLAVYPLVIWTIPVWLGMLAPFARRRTVVLLATASIVGVNAWLTVVSGFLPEVLFVQLLITIVVSGGILANLWLWRTAKEAHDGQEARARLAVSEERLRFARDLNDLLGQSLAEISARTAGAETMLATDPGAAAGEMSGVRDLARTALREVRSTVQSYRVVDLEEVLASVRAVLEAADVRCTVHAETAALLPETRTLLATVVREGATNVLKHSKAERCTITIEDGVLEMSNDGVGGPVGDHAPDGLGGLSRRVAEAGGTLSAAPTDGGGYLLRAAVPA